MAHQGCFNDIRFFVVCYGLLVLTDIMAGVMKKSSLTTIERRFNLPSTTTALLASSFQIGSLTTVLFASYFGSRWHRPRVIFLGTMFIVGGNLIATLPQFLGGRYEYDDISTNKTSPSSARIAECSVSNTNETMEDMHCEDDDKNPHSNLYILLVLGMMLNGVGGSVVQPLGISYIDDFAHPRNSPMYLGITKAIALVGPMMGYVVSAAVLKIWVDIGWVDTSTVSITPTHPSWVGAWWLGWIVCTSAIIITMMPLPYFPKRMKKQEYKGKKEAKFEQHADEVKSKELKEVDDSKKGSFASREIKKFTKTIKSMVTNRIFLLVLLKMYLANAAFVGIASFFPKYLEVGFGVSASKANLLTGVINIPCIVVGTLIGAFIMKRCNLGTVGTVKLIAVATFFATLSILPMLFIGCETINIAGVTSPYSDGNVDNLPNVNSMCNSGCACASGTYAPVCGADGISYISPCHAGCSGSIHDESGRINNFTECSCIPESGSWARPERCELSKCGNLVKVALAFKSLASLFAGVTATPMYIFMIRSVEPDQKSFAIGVYLLMIRVLAWIPGPLVYGALIDSTCLYWGMKPCSNRAYCKVYDNTGYRRKFYGLVVFCNILSCITAIILFLVVKKVHKKKSEKNENLHDGSYKLSGGTGDQEKPMLTTERPSTNEAV